MAVSLYSTCNIVKCKHQGRLQAIFGKTLGIYYCQKHKHIGSTIINYMILSIISRDLYEFLKVVREDIFIYQKVPLSAESEQSILNYMKDKTKELYDLEMKTKFLHTQEIDDGDNTTDEGSSTNT